MKKSMKILGPVTGVALIAFLALFVNAGESTVESASPNASNPTSPQTAADFAVLGINNLVNSSDVGVIGEVTTISAPKWNSVDGKTWEQSVDDGGPVGTPTEYRDATIKVTKVLFDQPGGTAAVGTEMKIRLYGTGIAGKGQKISETEPALTTDVRDGSFSVGATHLLLLKKNSFFIKGGTNEQVLQLTNGFQANWVLKGQFATSAEATRNAPVEALIKRIMEERKKGTVVSGPDDLTIQNPLAVNDIESVTSSTQGPNVSIPAPPQGTPTTAPPQLLQTTAPSQETKTTESQ